MIIATAPGKAVLSGEYAVLSGAPAVSMAVNTRAIVSIGGAEGETHVLRAPGYAEESYRFECNDAGEARWLDAPPSSGFRLFEIVWRLHAMGGLAPLSISIDTRAFSADSGQGKLGFGSSAAACVALAAALARLSAGDGAGTAMKAHREFQDGRGSGVDVATIIAGGLLAYRMHKSRHEALDWPAGLIYRFLYSGVSSDTREKIDRFDARQPDRQSVAVLSGMADAMLPLWRNANADMLMQALQQYTDALRVFSDDFDLGIFAAGHAELCAAAASDGLVYKPCGAGGGDSGIVLGFDASAVDAFCESAESAGFTTLDIEADARGVDVKVERA